MRLFVRGFLDDARRFLDLVDREIGAAGEVDQNAARALDRGLVEQRTRHGFLRGVQRAILALAGPGAHHREPHAGHDRADVGEVEVDEPGDQDQIRDPLHRLLQDRIGDAKRGDQRGAAVHHREQSLVGDRNQRVHDRAQRLEPGFGLDHALPALEGEGLGHDRDGQDAEVLRERRDHRRSPGPGAAAEPGGDEHHVGAAQQPRDLIRIFLRGAATDLGIRAGAQAPGELGAELDLDRRR